MTDDQTAADEVVEAPDGATPPDGDNDVSRLTRALEHEREERRQAKEELRLLREDEDHRLKWLTELGYEFQGDTDDDDDGYEDDAAVDAPDPRDKELEELRAWRQEVDSERNARQYERDLTSVLGGRDLTAEGKQVVEALTMRNGSNKKALEAAVETWFQIAPPSKKKQRAPHVVTGGVETTGVPDYSEMTRAEIDQAMFDRARAIDAQQ